VKTISKIATIAALLIAGITAASAQNTTRAPYDQPSRNWNSGLMMTGPSYYGGYGVGGWSDPSDYRSGHSPTNLFATPGSQEDRDIGNQGG